MGAADPIAFATFEALSFLVGLDEAGGKGRGGFGRDTPHMAWSASKSLLHAV